MTSGDDDLAEVDPSGVLSPRGQAARLRLQARAGTYRVEASPDEVILLTKVGITGDATSDDAGIRPCLLGGQVRSAGMLCDVLSFVGHTGWRGQFVVHGDGAARSVFFDGGHVTGAQSSVVRERLGEVLYRYGVLTREQVTRCGEATADGKLRFGEAAVKLGLLTREQLFGLMERQIEEIFYGLLLVDRGTFFFLEGYEEETLASRHALSLTTLVRDGIRRMHEMRYFRARIPSEEHVPSRMFGRQAPEAGGDYDTVYAAIDGRRSVAEICRALGTGEFEVTRSLFHLVQTGHVTIRKPALTPTACVDIYNAAIALLLRELDAMDEGDAVRTQLAAYAQKPPYPQLFAGAGPADDGTLAPARVHANLTAPNAPYAADEHLPGWLFDYVSYALFLARPHLRRRSDVLGPDSRAGEARPRLSLRVTEMLKTLSPDTDKHAPIAIAAPLSRQP